jgi:hypothetical protein
MPTFTLNRLTLEPVTLEPLTLEPCALYQANRECSNPSVAKSLLKEFIVSTPESRAICNDPFVLGVQYTRNLRKAGARAFAALREHGAFHGEESSTAVLTILRGGLNFELREALSDAFGWNSHDAWFISAQRRLTDPEKGHWEICEDAYSKIYPKGDVDVVLGDVVATGTSLRHGLSKLTAAGKENRDVRYKSVTFFTIGAAVSGDIVSEWQAEIEKIQGLAPVCTVVYFEGIFGVASSETPLSIKIDGTDLLRRDGPMAPEFLSSQYENPTYPLERCTIYDAGSRAFHVREYLEDVIDYWNKVSQLAGDGCDFKTLCNERCPKLDAGKFKTVTLSDVVSSQLHRLETLLKKG